MAETESAPAGADAGELPKLDARGQITLPLDGQDYQLRPSRTAISAIEAKLRPLTALVAEGSRGDLSLKDMGVISAELMHAFAEVNPKHELIDDYRGAKPERLADLIYEAGSPRILARLLAVLIGALNGGYTASGEARPPATT